MGRLASIFRSRPYLPVLLIAGLIRFIFTLDYLGNPQWEQLLVDSLFHDNWARAIASGDILGRDTFFRAPFYIYLLGGLYSLFGHSLLAARIFGHLLGLAAVLFTYLIAARVVSRRGALIAALLHAAYPVVVYFESELLVDNLFLMLTEASLLAMLVALEKKSRAGFIVTGLLIGLAAITRPVILALIPLYLIWRLWAYRPTARGIFDCILILLAVTAVILPVTVRNALVTDDPALIATSGGINFYIGNNSDADGFSASLPPPYRNKWQIRDIRYLAETETGRTMTDSEISSFYYHKGWDWIKSKPGAFTALYLKKLYLSVNNLELSNNRNLALFFRSIAVLRYSPLDFALLVSFAVFGLLALIFNREADSRLVFMVLYAVLYILVISLFFINARFRLPILPILFIFAGEAAVRIFNLFRSRRYQVKYIFIALAAIAAGMFSRGNVAAIARDDISTGLFNQANYALYSGRTEQAVEMYRRALAANPDYPDIRLNLGAAYLKLGRADSAAVYFQRELNRFPQTAAAYSNLASLAYLDSAYARALEYADRALSLRPYLVDAHLIKLRTLATLRDTLRFSEALATAGRNLPDNRRVDLEVGIIYSNWQHYDPAIDRLNRALQARQAPAETDDNAFGYFIGSAAWPHWKIRARAAYQLGYIYGLKSELSRSIGFSRLAIATDSGLTEAYINLANAYRLSGKSDSARIILDLATERFIDNDLIRSLSRQLQ